MDADDQKTLKNGDVVVINRYLVDEKDSFPPFSPLLLLSVQSSSYLLSPLEKPELTFTIPISSPLEKMEEVEKKMKKQERIWKIHNICFVILTGIFASSITWNFHDGLKRIVMNMVKPISAYIYVVAALAILLFFSIMGMELVLTYSPSEIKEFKEGKKRMEKKEKDE